MEDAVGKIQAAVRGLLARDNGLAPSESVEDSASDSSKFDDSPLKSHDYREPNESDYESVWDESNKSDAVSDYFSVNDVNSRAVLDSPGSEDQPGDVSDMAIRLGELCIDSPRKVFDDSCSTLESVRRRKSSLMSCDFDLLAVMEPPSEMLRIDEVSYFEDWKKPTSIGEESPNRRNEQIRSRLASKPSQDYSFLDDMSLFGDVLPPVEDEILDEIERSFQRERAKKAGH